MRLFVHETGQADDVSSFYHCSILNTSQHFLVIIDTILQIHNNRNLLPIITCAMLILGGVASFLALSIFSFTFAIISLGLWLGILALFVYIYVVPQRSSGLLPL
ncbi:hypothetical protein glysoja_034708 [Glycine soja]|uniref:Uncharacterized protein n=1 Tax=Glycine soja TaxID=3848 RepID=A0A0B2QGI1_GLYSO|nr:hypothetical protein glysoja_034708 [Glycine soja]